MNKILIICFIGISIFSTAIFIFKVPVNAALIYGGILLCPLMHLFMMDHGGHADKKSESHTNRP